MLEPYQSNPIILLTQKLLLLIRDILLLNYRDILIVGQSCLLDLIDGNISSLLGTLIPHPHHDSKLSNDQADSTSSHTRSDTDEDRESHMFEGVLDHMPELLETVLLVMMFVLVFLVAWVLAFEFAGATVDLGTSLGCWHLETEFAHAANPGRLHLLHRFQCGEASGLHLTEEDGADAANDCGASVFTGGGYYRGGLDLGEQRLKGC